MNYDHELTEERAADWALVMIDHPIMPPIPTDFTPDQVEQFVSWFEAQVFALTHPDGVDPDKYSPLAVARFRAAKRLALKARILARRVAS